jgi:hypothetical protein
MRRGQVWRAIILSIFLTVTLVRCGQPAVPAACASLERLPTPVRGDELAGLQAIMDLALEEIADEQWSAWHVNTIDADESRGTVVFGSSEPSEEMCDTLRARYGPLVEGVYSSPGTLF